LIVTDPTFEVSRRHGVGEAAEVVMQQFRASVIEPIQYFIDVDAVAEGFDIAELPEHDGPRRGVAI
jgi:hypothetical protein